ncbi:hypothetical protein Ahy_B04g070617 [Arachis hypogaea]|uniref:Reverse transcriptase zinc-binding domain-containing protein n=1 Tax=Arachis hypogaea TaxID=3818 RepID=A0A444ZHZ9_ARAHY|nr:hypothetical protein Ahy_B04g070617 [Arachis hypogaea]
MDSLVWALNSKKQYDVTSGYVVAYDFAHELINQLPAIIQNSRSWRKIWGLQLSTKIKIFLWRAVHESLPVLSLIYQCFQSTPPLCPRCRLSPKIIIHCLRCCGPTQEVWGAVDLKMVPSLQSVFPFVEWWTHILLGAGSGREGDDALSIFTALCWALWNACNKEVFENEKTPVQQISNSVRKIYQEMNRRQIF